MFLRMALVCLVAIGIAETRTLPAQDSRLKVVRAAGSVTVELYHRRSGVGLHPQQWSQAFSKAGVPVTIRGESYGDKPEVTETKSGATRQVKVVGELDARGTLHFGDRSFTNQEAGKVFQWLNDLRTYGAQGNPEGEPIWGLTKLQFGTLHASLAEPVAVDVQEQSLEQALVAFQIPKTFPVVWTPDGKAAYAERTNDTLRQPVKGVSKGTALAAVLNEMGLAFRPRRREDTRIDLEIIPLKGSKNVWPVGWPLKKPTLETVPTLFDMTQISLQEIDLASVLDAASEKVKLPILTDTAALAAQKIDLSSAMVSHPAKRTAWITALKDVSFQAKARVEVWIDEAGKPFVWITPNNSPRRPNSDPPIAAPGKSAIRQ